MLIQGCIKFHNVNPGGGGVFLKSTRKLLRKKREEKIKYERGGGDGINKAKNGNISDPFMEVNTFGMESI